MHFNRVCVTFTFKVIFPRQGYVRHYTHFWNGHSNYFVGFFPKTFIGIGQGIVNAYINLCCNFTRCHLWSQFHHEKHETFRGTLLAEAFCYTTAVSQYPQSELLHSTEEIKSLSTVAMTYAGLHVVSGKSTELTSWSKSHPFHHPQYSCVLYQFVIHPATLHRKTCQICIKYPVTAMSASNTQSSSRQQMTKSFLYQNIQDKKKLHRCHTIC